MKVNVEVLECTSRTKLEFRLTKDYIDIDAEGLFCNKKRKTQITLETDQAKKTKVEAEVKQEATSLQEVSENLRDRKLEDISISGHNTGCATSPDDYLEKIKLFYVTVRVFTKCWPPKF